MSTKGFRAKAQPYFHCLPSGPFYSMVPLLPQPLSFSIPVLIQQEIFHFISIVMLFKWVWVFSETGAL